MWFLFKSYLLEKTTVSSTFWSVKGLKGIFFIWHVPLSFNEETWNYNDFLFNNKKSPAL